MKTKFRESKIHVAGLILLSLSGLMAVGCGGAAPAPSTSASTSGNPFPQGVGCPPGYSSFGGQCVVSGGNFQQNCASVGGSVVGSNPQLCRVTYHASFGPYSGTVPRLTSSDPWGSNAYAIGQVKQGDKLSWNVGGSWNHDPGSFVTSWECDDESIGSQDFLASDGTEIFDISVSGSRTVSNNGTLRIGFNTTSGTACGTNVTAQFTLMRCEDSAGTSYPCP